MGTPLLGVQALVESGIAEIPGHYIKPADMRVKEAEIEDFEIPVIDLVQLQTEQRADVVKTIGDAAENWGFFQVLNHGVSRSVMSSMMAVSREFFEMPVRAKMAYHSECFDQPVQYGTSLNARMETHLQWHDHLLHRFPPHGEDHPWPENPASYKGVAQKYVKEVSALGKEILSALSESLGLDANSLDKAMGGQQQFLRLNYYPPCPNPELAMGQNEHSDAGGITILMLDEVAGLQARYKDKWCPVKPVPGALVVNIADQLQILSNGKYKSVRHRVAVNSTKTRLSVALFTDPSSDVVVAPIPDLIDDRHPPAYRPSRYGDFLPKAFASYISRLTDLET